MPVTIVGNNTPTAGGVVYGDGTNYASTLAGTSGQFLQSTGTGAPVWATSSGAPGGSNTQVQYNNSGSFAGSANFTFDGTGTTAGYFIPSSSTVPLRGMYLPSTNIIGFTTASTERTRIDNTGRQFFFNAGSATTIADCIFNFAGTFGGNRGISVNATDGTTGDMIVFATSGTSRGIISSTSSGTTYGTSSDYRLKENVQPMTGALAKVALLKPCTYTWKETGVAGQGFIAHELQEIVPEAVTGTKDGMDKDGTPDYQSIDTSFLVATLTAAIQELKAEVESLKAQLKGA